MIHEAYMPVYRCPDFHCAGAGPPEVVQEALADLKRYTPPPKKKVLYLGKICLSFFVDICR